MSQCTSSFFGGARRRRAYQTALPPPPYRPSLSSRMTHVARNSLLDVFDVDGLNVENVSVQNITRGMRVRDAITHRPVTVTSIMKRDIGAAWPMCAYMGLVADPRQWVYVSSHGWDLIATLGIPYIATQYALYAITVDACATSVAVDGIACHVYRHSSELS